MHPRRQRARAGRPVATAPEVERLVLGIAVSAATWGCRRIAAYLARTWQVRVAPSTVQRLLRRVGLATRRARLAVLELLTARTAGLSCPHFHNDSHHQNCTEGRGLSDDALEM